MLLDEGSGDRSCKDFIISPKFIQLLSNLFWRVLHLALPVSRLFLRRLSRVQLPTQSPPPFLPRQISAKKSWILLIPLFLIGWGNGSAEVSSSSHQKSPTLTCCFFFQGKFGAEGKFLFPGETRWKSAELFRKFGLNDKSSSNEKEPFVSWKKA